MESEVRKRPLAKVDSIPMEELIQGAPEPTNPSSSQAGIIKDEDIPQSGDTGALSKMLAHLPARWRNWWIRVSTSFLMLFGFIFIGYLGPLAIVLLILAIQLKAFHEIITIGYMVYRNYELPWFRSISWYFLFCANYYFYGETINEYFGSVLQKDVALHFLFKHHRIISYAMYSCGFIAFVCSLVKTFYRLQFFMFGWTHCTLLMVVVSSHLCMQNIFDGVIWFCLPVLLVCANDTWAYICGFFLGKRFINQPLTKLSPKKSWEGFVGGFICTLIWGFIFSWFLTRFPILTCPVRLDANWHVLSTCEPSEYFIPVEHTVPIILRPLFGLFGVGETVLIRPFQYHIAALGVFASFIAPFGGFFASGFKRAFKVKDFGDLIPGHGGVMDRMDCHFVMQSFTNVYLSTFIRTPSVQTVLLAAMKLSTADREWLIEQLQGIID
ncbi:Oidioi.mRNA.OKI2018_I69.XSR.g16782.t1.cds [Oikopleura dioica]|uniref:Phosphatidate cytidylyltransferase n=1 Tax=Oikopleura dioica TaxID=34765 RepID=A0ABN7SH81_OIKDI|nr:Oidioi.mRNA.OKI2018_I69.XSR.g16782.t1.cds [Oikopleura dioica]